MRIKVGRMKKGGKRCLIKGAENEEGEVGWRR